MIYNSNNNNNKKKVMNKNQIFNNKFLNKIIKIIPLVKNN